MWRISHSRAFGTARTLTPYAMPQDLAAPWMVSLKAALNHGGTRRPKRDRREAKRKHVQLATVDPDSGRPSCRTVAFRGFLTPAHLQSDGGCVNETSNAELHRETCLLTFVTDSRAEKVGHLSSVCHEKAFVELCWWLDEAGVQFRISGRAVLAFADSTDPELRTLCRSVWNRLQPSTQNTFFWQDPGAPRSSSLGSDERTATHSDMIESSTHQEVFDASLDDEYRDTGVDVAADTEAQEGKLRDANFCVLVVMPDRVDELHLGGNQKRLKYSLASFEKATSSEGLLAKASGMWSVADVNP
eukprot:TRINITY_DN76729_c0_g1_i1.p1 TRINITY_DN76729_c0_g1~~TRINITY_DN76729_c0_g1_i1.p1  ORF type:complete len:301 (-),score=21.97 TRINITY_DN76729_c0_g1_i1:159-1061(-)